MPHEYISRMLKISLSEADIYRKAFAKNKWKLKNEFKSKLRIRQPKMTEEDIQFICDKLESLQSHSFCKSHAYSYAYLLFALAYQNDKSMGFGRRHLKIVIQVIENGHIIEQQFVRGCKYKFL